MSVSRDRLLAYGAVALSVLMGALFAPLYKTCLQEGMQPITTMFVRFVLVGGGLLLFSLLPRERRRNNIAILRQKGVWPRIFVLGLLRAAELLLWAYALRGTNSFVVNILGNAAPLFVLGASYLFLHERTPFPAVVGVCTALCGLAIVSLSSGSGGATPLSVVLMITASVIYTSFMFISRRLRTYEQPLPTALLMGLVFAICVVVYFFVCAGTGAPFFPYTVKLWLLVLGLTFFNTFLGLLLPVWAIQALSASTVSMVSLAGPLLTAVLCYFLLGEIPSLQVLVGGSIVLVGLFLYLWQGEKARHRSACPAPDAT